MGVELCIAEYGDGPISVDTGRLLSNCPTHLKMVLFGPDEHGPWRLNVLKRERNQDYAAQANVVEESI